MQTHNFVCRFAWLWDLASRVERYTLLTAFVDRSPRKTPGPNGDDVIEDTGPNENGAIEDTGPNGNGAIEDTGPIGVDAIEDTGAKRE